MNFFCLICAVFATIPSVIEVPKKMTVELPRAIELGTLNFKPKTLKPVELIAKLGKSKEIIVSPGVARLLGKSQQRISILTKTELETANKEIIMRLKQTLNEMKLEIEYAERLDEALSAVALNTRGQLNFERVMRHIRDLQIRYKEEREIAHELSLLSR